MAVLGLTAIVIKISDLRMLIFVCGVCFLLYLAYKSWQKPVENGLSASIPQLSIKRTILYTLGASLLNPYALMDTILSIGTASTVFSGHHKLIFALGCITASWLWFGFIGFAGLKLGDLYLLRRYEGKISAIMMLMAALFLIYFFYIHS
jgi:L-lysine exporter family protein LysE/ArgO